MASSVLAAATDYLKRGWSVVPMRVEVVGEKREKRPLIEWQQYQAQPPTEAEVQAWAERWPDMGIAIVTGAVSGLVVLDEDVAGGGDASLAQLTAQHGALPATPIVHTAGGGRHFYFRHPGSPVPNAVGFQPGLDLRGDGGLVVAPPTVLPDGRGWVEDSNFPLSFLSPAPLPEWLLEMVRPKAGRPGRIPQDELARLFGGVGAGERHAAMVKLMGHFITRRVSRAVLQRIMEDWNSRCDPPLPHRELSGQFEDMWSRWGQETATPEEDIATLRELPKKERYPLVVDLARRLAKAPMTTDEMQKLRQRLSEELNYPKAEFNELWKAAHQKEEEPRRTAPTVFARSLLAEAQKLLHDPALLYRVFKATRAAGVVGEEENALLLYLAMTSRLLANPVSVSLQGESAAGKSWLVTRVAKLLPKECVEDRSRLSPQALFYTDMDLRHKVLYIAELVGGIPGDYAIRLIQSEGIITAEVTKRDEKGMFSTQKYSKEGPTAIITTTTRVELNPENASRQWSLFIDDSPEQTRRVKNVVFTRSTAQWREPDLSLFQALQTELRPRQVFVPESWRGLVDKTPNEPVRMRRDFERLLAVIRTLALLHQYQRGQGDQIEACWQDFYLANRVLKTAFGKTVGQIPDSALAAFAVLKELAAQSMGGPVWRRDLMRRLGVSDDTVERRLGHLVKAGVVGEVGQVGGKGRQKGYVVLRQPQLPELPGFTEIIPDASGTVVDPFTGQEFQVSPQTARGETPL